MGTLKFVELEDHVNKSILSNEQKKPLKKDLNGIALFYIKKNYLDKYFKHEQKQDPRESKLFLAKKFVFYALKNQLTQRNLTFGFRKNQTNSGYYSYIDGFNDNVTLIKTTLLVFYMRKNFKFLLFCLLKNYRFCFVGFEMEQYEAGHFFNYHIILDKWFPGSVSNFKKLSKQSIHKKGGFLKRVPQFIVTLGGMQPDKSFDITKEAVKAGLFIVNFLDSNVDLVPFS